MIQSMITKEMIKPGHNLIVIGNYGSGRWTMTRQAILEKGLVPFQCEVPSASYLEWRGVESLNENMVWDMQNVSITTFEKFVKGIPGNGVLVINNIERMQPMFIVSILEQMFNPDRPMVMIGSAFDYLPILNRSTIVKL